MATLEDATQWMLDNYGGFKDRHLCYHNVDVYWFNDEPWYTDNEDEDIEAPFIYRDDFAVFRKPFDWRKYPDEDNDPGYRLHFNDGANSTCVPVLSEKPRKFVRHTLQITEEKKYFILRNPKPKGTSKWVPSKENFMEVAFPVRGFVFRDSMQVCHKMDQRMENLRHLHGISTRDEDLRLAQQRATVELASQLLLKQAFEECGAPDEVLLTILEFTGSSVGKLESKRVCTKCFRVQTFSCPIEEAMQKEREIMEKLSAFEPDGEKTRKFKIKSRKKNKKQKTKDRLEGQLAKYRTVLCPHNINGHTFQMYAESRV